MSEKKTELNEEMLETVAGGASADGPRYITGVETCDDFTCRYCGGNKDAEGKHRCPGTNFNTAPYCLNCKHFSHYKGYQACGLTI